jgi:uncharacterized repeat protein (TIGR03803 family)
VSLRLKSKNQVLNLMYYETTKIRTRWNGFKGMVVLALIGWLAATTPAAAQFTLLHSFSGEDGAIPSGSLTLSGSTLYGMTHEGGSSGKGTVFRINTDGTGFKVLHSFSGEDGAIPDEGSLTLSGSTLYGITRKGGSSDNGTVFKINTDGTGFRVLHSFSSEDGDDPCGPLTLSGSTLYGMTVAGGSSDMGTVFKINTDGTGFRVLHTFSGEDGAFPDECSLTLSGSTLYGMTRDGGSSDLGTVFKINTDGTGFRVLYTFSGYKYLGNDGLWPTGSLTLSGSTLYGITREGGSIKKGTVFKINTDGTGFRVQHSFSGEDGAIPFGSLTLSGSTLYGITREGGSSDKGTVFRINTDGTGFKVLHSFSREDGAFPFASLTLSGSTFYGITTAGGSSDKGTVFKINTDGTGFKVLHSFSREDGAIPYGSLTLSGSTLYGTTADGGSGGKGTVFSIAVP